MRYLIILSLLFLTGCATPKFYPIGDSGNTIPYYNGKKTCSKCHKQCVFFKLLKNKKVICADCYEAHYR